MANLNAKQIDWIVSRCEEKFWFFTQTLLPPEWYDEEFHRALCDFLQYGGINKLVILPRTHLKTTICSKLYPLWRSTFNTSLRTLIVTNTAPNAEKTVHEVRDVVESNALYAALFPEVIPQFNKVRWSDRCACLNRKIDFAEGTFESAGVNTAIIRRHFNLIIEDDTVAPKKDDLTGQECMPGKEDIEQAVGFHRLTPPLLINEEDETLVVGTRWASYDHINYIMENQKYNVFDKPAISFEGKPLYKRFSLNRLEAIRIGLGTKMFSSLYLNKPLAREFMTFKPEWIQYYEENELPVEGSGIVTVDPADPPTGNKRQDYSAIVSAKHCNTGIYVRRYRRERVSDHQLIAHALDIAEQDGAYKVRVEVDRYAHLQYGFKEEMSRRGKYFSLDAVKTRGKNKNARIRDRLQPMFENGVVKIKRGMRELEEELFQFPDGSHDDLIDALAWQIEQISVTNPPPPSSKKDEKKRHLPTVDDMYDSLVHRGMRMRYPFQKQVEGGLLGRPFGKFNN